MEKRAIAITVGSIITMLLLAFLIWCTVLFWQNKAKKDTSYQDGYDAGLEDKSKLEIEITELKKDKSNLTVQLADAQNTITANNANIESLNSQKSELQSQVTKLTATNELNAQEITRLSTIKTENENKINELTAQNATQTATINQHIATIATNNATIKNLQSVNEDCETQIASLNLQLTSANTNKNELQQKITGYEATIEQNKLQIASLQATRTELETRINDLNDSSSQQSSTIATQKALISEYMTIIATNDVTIQNLQSENATAEAEISNLNSQLSTANASINELEQQITGYKATVEQNKLQIADLQATKVELQARIDDLTASNTQNSTTITSLQAHINSLNEQITQLTKTNNTNIATISQLNTQISSLTNRINELSALNVEQSQKISDLNSQVVKLTNYIQKYEQFLSGFESDTQAVATFEYDGALYAIQLVTNGGYASVTTPTSTQYVVFSGWTVNNEIVDISTYPITENTKFVASVTYKYDVQFVADDDIVESQIVAKGSKPTEVTAPVKAGYRFLGWSKDGVNIVDPTTVAINGTTTFTALYIQQFSVRFLDDNSTELKTQTLDKSAKATAPAVTSTDHKVFNGWTVSGAIVDVSNYPITQNTDFVANYTYKYDVLFKNGDTTVSTQLIVKDNCATVPTTPTKDGYKFLGWSINGTDTVAPATYKITANTTFTALWIQLHTVSFMRGDSVLDTQIIEHGKTATAPTVASTTYEVFNGWTLDGKTVTPNTYTINANAVFVADITYKYDVKFMNGTTTVSTQIVVKGECASAVTNPVKAGYRFLGWSKDGVNIVDPTTVAINGTTTFTALYIQQFSVRFLDDNSTELKTQTLDKSAKATAPAVTSTDHKVFNGWTVSGAIVDVSNYPITQNTDFVANYTYKYDVLFKNGDTTVSTQLITKNNCATVPTTPTKDGYKFLGWSINGTDTVAPATYKITANTTFTALWIQLHTVSFMRGDSVLDTQIIEHGKTAIAPTVASTTYEVFNGWTLNGKSVTPNTYTINANAVFIADITYKYDVKFMNGNTAVSTQIVVKGECATAVTNPVKAGYRFLGWSKDGVNIVDPTTVAINGTTTFTALYIQQFSVRFLDDNSTELKTQTLDKSAKATAPTVTSTDHKVFNGWTVSGAIVDVANYPITQNTDFVANYTYKYDVLFKNGDSTVSTQLITKNNCATAPTIESTTYKVFNGWKVNNAIVNVASYKITQNTTFVADITYKYDVLFKDGDTTVSTQLITKNNCATAPTTPTKDGYKFVGWSINGTDTVAPATYKITANTTFIALWEEGYTVTFMNDTTQLSQQVLLSNETISAPTAPTVSDKAFAGWSLDKYNVVDLTNYNLQSDVTFYAVYANPFIGHWTGTCVTEGYDRTIELFIYDSGIGNITSVNSSDSQTSSFGCLKQNEENVYYLKCFMDSYYLYLQDNNTLKITKTSFGISYEFVLTKSNERLSQSYIVDFNKKITIDGSTYPIIFDGYGCTLIGKNYSEEVIGYSCDPYVILGNKIVVNSKINLDIYSDIIFELTDTSITLGTNTYIFAQDVDDSTQEKETAGQSSYTK